MATPWMLHDTDATQATTEICENNDIHTPVESVELANINTVDLQVTCNVNVSPTSPRSLFGFHSMKHYDFTKMVNKISCKDTLIIIFYMFTLWMNILIYLIWNLSTNRIKKKLYGAILFLGFVSSIIHILLNPLYFQKFVDRHKPKNLDQISISKIEETKTTNPINPSLVIPNDVTTTDRNNVNKQNETENNEEKVTCCTSCKKITVRMIIFGISICILFGTIIQQSSFAVQSFFGGIHILITMVFNFYFVSHCIVYYRRTFWKWNGILWLILTVLLVFIGIGNVQSDQILLYFLNSFFIFLFYCIISAYVSSQRKKHLLHSVDPVLFEDSLSMELQNCQWNFGGSIKDIDEEMYVENVLNTIVEKTEETYTEKTLNEIKQRKMRENKRKSRKKFVKCCFGQIKCEFKTCLRIQSFMTSISFWLFMAFTWITGVGGTVQGAAPSAMFILMNLWYNPLYFSDKCIKIRNKKWCCNCSKYIYYFITFNGFLWGIIVNLLAMILYIFNAAASEDTLIIWFWGAFLFVCGTYFFAASGYSFYQIPVQFVISHLLGSALCFIFPVSIFLENLNLLSYEEGDRLYGIWIAVVAVGIFLSLSGSSCSCWRFSKSLIETQSFISGHKKGLDTKEFPLTIIMVTTFLAAIIDFITDAVWVFDKNTWSNNSRPVFKIIGYVLFFIQILVQILSISKVMGTLRKQLKFDKNTTTYLGDMKKKWESNRNLCCLCLFRCILYPLIWILYSIGILILSMVLAITKLLAIKQVREWWLSWIISDYTGTIRKHSSMDDTNKMEIEMELKRVSDLTSYEASGCWCWYYRFEALTPVWMLKYKVNSSVYNNYLISELIVESVPLLILNIVNSYYGGWSVIAYCSALSSSLYILYSLFKVAYYVGYLDWDLTKFVL